MIDVSANKVVFTYEKQNIVPLLTVIARELHGRDRIVGILMTYQTLKRLN